MNLLEIYYKSKLHFGYNLLKRAFFHTNFKKQKEKKLLDLNNLKNVDFIKQIINPNNAIDKTEKIIRKDSEDTKEQPTKTNIFRWNYSKVSSNNNDLLVNVSGNSKIIKKEKIKKIKKKMTIINPQGIKKLKLRKDKLNSNISSGGELVFSKKNTIEKEENNNDNSKFIFISKKKI